MTRQSTFAWVKRRCYSTNLLACSFLVCSFSVVLCALSLTRYQGLMDHRDQGLMDHLDQGLMDYSNLKKYRGIAVYILFLFL